MRGYVLAGGRSRRMGRDKARVAIDGIAMALRVALALRDAGLDVVIVRRGADPGDDTWAWPEGAPIPVLREADVGEAHPLWGVVTALNDADDAGDHLALVVPCDLPDLTGLAVGCLLDAGTACIAVADGREHPLLGVLPVALAETAAALAADGAPVRALVRHLRRVDVPAGAVRNVNRL